MTDTRHYDIYGFTLSVTGAPSLTSLFDLHYGLFRRDAPPPAGAELLITPSHGGEAPIKRLGAVVGLALDHHDGRVTLSYEHGVDGPFIMNFADLLMWWPDKVKVHSGGVVRDGRCFLFFAPADTGKTGTTLHLLKRGFEFLSDDWVVVDRAGNGLLYPKPIRIYDYNLARDRQWCRRLYPRTWPLMYPLMRARIAIKNHVAPRLPTRVLRYAVETVLAYPLAIEPPPIDGDEPLAPRPIHTIFWLEKNDSLDDIVIEPMSSRSLIDKVVYVFFYEWASYLRHYHTEAMVKGGIARLDGIEAHYREVLADTFAGANLARVSFPRSRRGVSLFEAIRTRIEADPCGPRSRSAGG